MAIGPANEIAHLWRSDDQSLASHAETFQALSRVAEAAHGDPDTRAFLVELAADYAWLAHPGLFVASALESAAAHGMGLPQPTRSWRGRSAEHVLHVLTEAYLTGGHSRLAWRWMESDSARIHSVAFTGSALGVGAQRVIEAASRTGGTVYDLGVDQGGVVARARGLRDAAAAHDIIVLHIQPHDSLPIAALAGLRDRPPILLVNHADHVFWLGASLADVVVCLRESGARLAESRRGIEPRRIAIVPVPISRPIRIVDRAIARSRLGLRESDILAICVGASYKFTPIRGLDFVAACANLAHQISALQIRAIGPQPTGSWAAIEASTGGRVAALGHQHDLSAFYAAADLYLDPFPFSSLTAFLEAGRYSIPIVSLDAYSSEAEVLSGDSPGLEGVLRRPATVEELVRIVAQLSVDPVERTRLGTETSSAIATANAGPGWIAALEAAYAAARRVGPAAGIHDVAATPGELDALLVELHRDGGGLARALNAHMPQAPVRLRLAIALALGQRGHRLRPTSYLGSTSRRRLRALRE